MQRHALAGRLARLMLLVWLGVALGAPALANLRAPIIDQRKASTVLTHSSQGLVVEDEQLFLRLGKPYSGNPRDLPHEPRLAEIEAIYHIHSAGSVEALFEFVMAATPGKVEVIINASPAADAQVTQIEERIESGPYQGQMLPPAAAKVSFSGALRAGANEIRVRYSQPQGRDEIDHGYFKTSKWASTVAYELWPLHEWQLAPDFRMQVEVSAEDDTSALRRLLFGSRYSMELRALQKPAPAAQTQSEDAGWFTRDGQPLATNGYLHEAGRLIQRYTLGPDFPPRIVAVVRE